MKRIALVFLLFVSASVFAQETRSTLTGRITDASGAVIPHAQITVTNTDTGFVTATQSNGVGDYTAPFLLPGHYNITVASNGFEKYVHEGLILQTEQILTENISLKTGAATETVTVQGETPLVDIATATTGQVLTAEEVEDLPSNGRSPIGFGHLMYGAVAKGKHSASQVRPFDNSTGSDFSIAGGNSQSN